MICGRLGVMEFFFFFFLNEVEEFLDQDGTFFKGWIFKAGRDVANDRD